MKTPQYIKALLIPNGQKPNGRKIWSIDLETVWLPFLTATNITGDTQISPEALGAPLRLTYNADGTVKFTKSGRPQIKVVKELSDSVRMVRENFTATLTNYASSVINENPEAYKQQVEAARRAGEPIVKRDNENMQEAMRQAMEDAISQAEAQAETQAQTEAKGEPATAGVA